MEINVTIDKISLDSIIGETQEQTGEDSYTAHPRTIADAIVYRAAQDLKRDDGYITLRRRVMEIRDSEIKQLVMAEIQAAMTGPINRTNGYGEPTGTTTTLRELIMAEVNKFFTEKRGSSYNKPGVTGAQQAIIEEVNDKLGAEMKAAVAEEKAMVVAAVRGKAAEMIAAAVKEGLSK